MLSQNVYSKNMVGINWQHEGDHWLSLARKMWSLVSPMIRSKASVPRYINQAGMREHPRAIPNDFELPKQRYSRLALNFIKLILTSIFECTCHSWTIAICHKKIYEYIHRTLPNLSRLIIWLLSNFFNIAIIRSFILLGNSSLRMGRVQHLDLD